MAGTIYTLIHPYYDQFGDRTKDDLQEENTRLYRQVVRNALEHPNNFLFYVATTADAEDWLTTTDSIEPEVELQRYLRRLPPEQRARVAMLDDKEGIDYTIKRLCRPRFVVTDALDGTVDPEESSLSWFARNDDAPTFYDKELRTAYTDVTGVTGTPAEEMVTWHEEKSESAKFHTEGGTTYLSLPLHPEVGKVAKFLGLQEGGRTIQGKSTLTVKNTERQHTKIVGSGEDLDSCVFDLSMGLAIALGIHVRNVSLNEYQPHITREGKRDLPIWRRPAETLYPPVQSPETMRPGFRK